MKKIFNTYKIFAIALMGLILMGSPVQKAAYAQSAPELEMVLEKLNEDYLEVTNAIPNRLDFSGGESGYYISYGNGMFWDGNYISTNIGDYVQYSNNNISSTTYFGGQGQYFTRKFPGLFVLAANLNGVIEFTVSGEYDFYYPTLDGTELTSGGYKGFVKRATSDYSNDPTVNHLIIVKDDPQVTHTYSNSGYNYYHTISGLNNTSRIYHLLYAGSGGFYIDDEATQQIMDAFVGLLITDTIPPNPVSNLMVRNIMNSGALITFTAPYDDSLTEPLTAYDVRLSTTPINAQNYFDAPVYDQSLTPGSPGSTDSLFLTDMAGTTQYWFGISTIDEGGNFSSPVFTSFSTLPDPAIAVSIAELELEFPIGEIVTSSFQISNTEADAGPLSYSINSSNQQFQETMAYAVKDNYTISKVDFSNHTIHEYYTDINISGLVCHNPTGNLWMISNNSGKLQVFSPATNLVIMTQTISSPKYIFTTKDHDKIGVVYASYPVKIDIYDPATLQVSNTFQLSLDSDVFDAKFSSDGSRFYIASYTNLVEYNTESGQVLNTFNPEYYDYFQFTISDDGNYAYCNSYYYSNIVKFNLSTGDRTTGTVNYESNKLALSPNGESLYIGFYYGNQIQVMNTQTMNVVHTLNKPSSEYTNDLQVSGDGSSLYCLNRYSPNLFVFDLQSSSIVQSYNIGGNTTRFTFDGQPGSLLTLNPDTGIIAGGESQEIEISLDTENMLPGIYQSELSIESNDPQNPLILIPVKLIAKDITGPEFNMVFFHNNYLTSSLKVIIFAHELLDELPELTAGGESLEVEKLDSLNFIYNSTYTLNTTEDITFTVSGTDSLGNASTFERVLSSTQVFKNTPVVAAYPGDRVQLNIGDDNFASDLFVTIWEEATPEEVCYHLGPESMDLNGDAHLTISYAGTEFANMNPQHIVIYRKDIQTGSWEMIPGIFNTQQQCIKAAIDQLGIFKLGFDDSVFQDEEVLSSSVQALDITPNPFKNEAVIHFENPLQGQVEISVYDLTGNKVNTVLNEAMPEGPTAIALDGKLLKPGIYICKINTSAGETVKRFVKVK